MEHGETMWHGFKNCLLSFFWQLKITGREICIFGSKYGNNLFGLMELQILDVNIA